ncbi:MAG TPA: SDR family oxidoreductase [Bacteroidales bacterium]|nr:SDR family oxidoreductase [Bacteroidales bacterium]
MKKVILITGVSTGFGRAAASLLAERGHTVYGTVRRDCETDPKVNVLKMDLTKEDSVKEAVDTIVSREGRIDVLINNAGMHIGGPCETSPMEHVRLIMDTNFLGMVRVTRAVLPVMRKQQGGRIINFSSIGGLMGLPFQPYYSASKFAIEGFSEALRAELLRFRIKVIVINPGDFNTNNTKNRQGFLAPTGEGDPYRDNYANALANIERDETNGGKPEKLAAKLVKIVECKNPASRYKIGAFIQKISVSVKRMLTASTWTKIIAMFYNIKY